MADVGTSMANLDRWSGELDQLSKDLADVQRSLEPAVQSYEDFVDDFIAGMHADYEENGRRLPAEDVRNALARKAMPEELKGRVRRLRGSEQRMNKRIATLKSLVDAERSVLSALKTELEATR